MKGAIDKKNAPTKKAVVPVIKGGKAGASSSYTPKEDPDSLHSTAYVRILLALGEGPWEDIRDNELPKKVYFDGTPIQNADGSYNYDDVTLAFRPGLEEQSYISGLPGVENTITVGVDWKYGEGQAWVRQISNTNLDAVRVRLGVPRLVTQKDNGDLIGAKVDYRIDLAVGGGAYKPVVEGSFNGKTTSLSERDHRIDLPKSSEGWRIRCVRLTPESTSTMLVNATEIKAFTEIIDVKLTYPHTALLYVSYSAETFSSIPQISIHAKGRQISIPSNYDPVNHTTNGVWDGVFKQGWTDNPAWVVFDAITNDRFSIGNKVPATLLDKWQMYRIAQRCDELIDDGAGGKEIRYKCDVYLQNRTQAWDLIKDLCALFCGMSYWGNRKLNFVSDAPVDPVQVLTNANVVDGLFLYKGGHSKYRKAVANVSYDDPSNHYDSSVISVPVRQYVARYGYGDPIELSGIGITRKSQAQRRGRYAVLTNMLDETVEFTIGMEGVEFIPTDVVAIADSDLSGAQVGGRISKPSIGRVVYLDRSIDSVVTTGDSFIVRGIEKKTAERHTIVSVSADRKSITLADDIKGGVAAFTPWVIDAKKLSVRMFRIISAKWNEAENTFTCLGLIYNPDKYDAVDKGARLDERPTSLIPAGSLESPKDLSVNSFEVVRQGIRTTTVTFSWGEVKGVSVYEIQWKRDNNDWINVASQATREFDLQNAFAGDYMFRVRAVSSYGSVSSSWASTEAFKVSGRAGSVPKLASFQTTTLLFGVQLDWSFAENSSDAKCVTIEYSSNEDGSDSMLLSDVPYPATQYQQMGLRIGATFYYRAQVVDKQGNQSEWTDWIEGRSKEDAKELSEDILKDIQASEEWKVLINGVDANTTGFKEQQELLKQQQKELEQQKKDITDQSAAISSSADSISINAQNILSEAQSRANADSQLNTQINNVKTQVSNLEESSAESITDLRAQLNDNTYEPFEVWNFDTSVDNFTSNGSVQHNDAGTVTLTPTNIDPYLVSPSLSVDGGLYPLVSFRARRVSGNQGEWDGRVYFVDESHPFNDKYAGVFKRPNNDTDWNIFSVEMPDSWKQSKTISKIRLDISANSSEVWEIDWVSIGRRSVGASANAINSIKTSVNKHDDQLTSQGVAITGLKNDYSNIDSSVKANSTAINNLQSKVTSQGKEISSVSSNVTTLNNRYDNLDGKVSSNSNAIGTLQSSVKNQNDKLTSQGSAITSLQSDLNSANDKINTTSSSVSGLTSRVTKAEKEVSSQGQNITSLNNTLSGVQSTANDANKKSDANANAINGLTSKVTASEKEISSQGQNITSLTASVYDLASSGANLVTDSSFENFSSNAGVIRASTTAARTGSRCAKVIALYESNNNDFEYGERFRTSSGRIILVEAWVRNDPNTAVEVSSSGHFDIGIWARVGGNHSWVPAAGLNVSSLSPNWVKLSGYAKVPDEYTSIAFWGRMPGGNNNKNSSILIDDISMQDVTEAYNAGVLSDANANAISSLTNTVTQQGSTINSHSNSITNLSNSVSNAQNTANDANKKSDANANSINSLSNKVSSAESGITSQGNSITSLENSISDLSRRGTNLVNNSDFSNGMSSWVGYGDNVKWGANAGENGTPGVIMTKSNSSNPQLFANNFKNIGISTATGRRQIRVAVRAKGISGACNLMIRVWRFGSDGGSTSNDSSILTFSTSGFETKYFDIWISNPEIRVGIYCYNQNASVAVSEVQMYDVTDEVLNNANASAISTLSTNVTSQGSMLSSQASQVTSLTSTVNGHTSSIQNINSVTSDLSGKVSALYTMRIATTSGGKKYVAGMQLGVNNAGSFGSFLVDQFSIITGSSGTPQLVFTTKDGKVIINSAVIGDATIGSAKIADASITNAKISGNLYSSGYKKSGQGGWMLSKSENNISIVDENSGLRIQIGKITGRAPNV